MASPRVNTDMHSASQHCEETSSQRSIEKKSTDSGCTAVSWSAPHLRPHLTLSRLEGCPTVRSPRQLHLHPALAQLDLVDVVGELNEAARLRDEGVLEPILITTTGTVLTG